MAKAPLRTPKLTNPRSEECAKAAVILERTHDSANALLGAFELARAERGKPRGISTDDEQDLLRAMLVMAGAGLDSMVKQLVRDAMPSLVPRDARVRDRFQKFVAKSLRADPESPEALAGTSFLDRILTAPSYQSALIEEYIGHLTGGSLQSSEELSRTADALALHKTNIDHAVLKRIFDVRNKIIHELDINLDGDRRKRNHRGLEDMKRFTRSLLEVAEQMLSEVDDKLTEDEAAA